MPEYRPEFTIEEMNSMAAQGGMLRKERVKNLTMKRFCVKFGRKDKAKKRAR